MLSAFSWPVATAVTAGVGVATAVYLKFLKKKPKYQSHHMADGALLELFEKTVRPTDVFISTTPKSGQTWLTRLILELRHQGDAPMDNILRSAPWIGNRLDVSGMSGDLNSTLSIEECMRLYEKTPDPRVFKMHETYEMVPIYPNGPHRAKLITITRDLRDVPYSMYRHLAGQTKQMRIPFPMSLFVGQLELSSFEKFMEKTFFTSLMDYTFWQIIPSMWPHRNDENFLWLRYEDLQADLRKETEKIVKFLQWDWVTPEIIDRALPKVAFCEMQQHSRTLAPGFDKGNFFREGKIGENRKQLTPEMEQRIVECAKKRWPRECVDYVFAQGGVNWD